MDKVPALSLCILTHLPNFLCFWCYDYYTVLLLYQIILLISYIFFGGTKLIWCCKLYIVLLYNYYICLNINVIYVVNHSLENGV